MKKILVILPAYNEEENIGQLLDKLKNYEKRDLYDILVIDDENKSYSVVVEIPEGADYETIFDILTENGLVSQPLLTEAEVYMKHFENG